MTPSSSSFWGRDAEELKASAGCSEIVREAHIADSQNNDFLSDMRINLLTGVKSTLKKMRALGMRVCFSRTSDNAATIQGFCDAPMTPTDAKLLEIDVSWQLPPTERITSNSTNYHPGLHTSLRNIKTHANQAA